MSWDAAQTLLAAVSLFAGGYGGTRAGGVVRVRTEARMWLWSSLERYDQTLWEIELNISSVSRAIIGPLESARRSLDTGADSSVGTPSTIGGLIEPLPALADTWIEQIYECKVRAELLPWSERAVTARYLDLLPTDLIGSVRGLAIDVRLSMMFAEVVLDEHHQGGGDANDTRYAMARVEELQTTVDRLRKLADVSEVGNARLRRRQAVAEVRTHLLRRLRPRWWTVPAEWKATFSLLRNKFRRTAQ